MQSLPAMRTLVPKLCASGACKVLPLLQHRPQLRLLPISTLETLRKLSGASCCILQRNWTLAKANSIPVSSKKNQLVSIQQLERRLEEAYNNMLTVMQAHLTDALVTIERKISTLLTRLSHLPEILSSAFDNDNLTDGIVDKDSEFVSRVFKEQTARINNEVADLIPAAGSICKKSKKLR
ncbi:hypothetical protein ACOME3_007548 [Neoechinorhynchus agilis]